MDFNEWQEGMDRGFEAKNLISSHKEEQSMKLMKWCVVALVVLGDGRCGDGG